MRRLPRSLRNVSLLGIFLLFCLQVLGFALFTFRAASMRYTETKAACRS
nr:MAG TPA: Protein of unknown function (DUF2615) [Caudoviricetes sp.]